MLLLSSGAHLKGLDGARVSQALLLAVRANNNKQGDDRYQRVPHCL